MHIIVLENEPSSCRGGQELSLFDVCLGLSQRGHSISLLYIKEGNLLKQYCEFCTHVIKVSGYRINRNSIVNCCRDFLVDLGKIATSESSLVYSNQYHDSFWAYGLALSKHIPFVCHLRLPPPPALGIQWSIGMHGANRLIAVSHQTKLDWVNKGFIDNKIDVVYNAINTERFKAIEQVSLAKKESGIPENNKIISYVGRLDKDKGIETMMRGFSLLFKSGKNANLLIAGKPLCQKYEYQKYLEQLTVDLGIEKHVKFLGHLTNPIPLYQISDVSVLASLNSEPFGRSIIESMACGTPVVASRTGGISEILTGEFSQGLFQPGDEQDFANTLNFVLKLKEQDNHLKDRCREHILNNFNLDKMIDGIEQVFLKVINC